MMVLRRSLLKFQVFNFLTLIKQMFSNFFNRLSKAAKKTFHFIHKTSSHINRVAKAVRSLPIPIISDIANNIVNISGLVGDTTKDIIDLMEKYDKPKNKNK